MLTGRAMCLGGARGRGKKTVDGRGCGIPFGKKKLIYTPSPRGLRSHILSTFVSDSAPYTEFLTVLVTFILRGLVQLHIVLLQNNLAFMDRQGGAKSEGPYWRSDSLKR